MKQLHQLLVLIMLLATAAISFAQQDSSNTTSTGLNMKGAYSMLRQVANDGTTDSLMNTEQFKIYTDRYMIYVHPRAGDTLAEYGIGLWEVKNGKVMEYVFHNSERGAVRDSFGLNISRIGNGYKQIIHFPEGEGRRWTLIEDYINVSRPNKTPLDGAWKQTKVTYTAANGRKQINNNPTQFKVFESGYFIWVQSALDSATKRPVSYYGYGNFEMEGTNKFTEINTSSTFRADLLGVPVSIQLAFPAKDTYRQTIIFPDGARLVEDYKKLK